MSVYHYPIDGFRRVLIPQKCGWTLAYDSRSYWGAGAVTYNNNDYPAKDLDCMFVREPVARFMSAYRNKVQFNTISYQKHNGSWSIYSGILWVAAVLGIHPDRVSEYATVPLLLDVLEDIIKKNPKARFDRDILDPHWSPQTWHAEDGHIPSRLYDIRFDHRVLDTLKINYSSHEHNNTIKYGGYQPTDEEIGRIKQLYACDVELYQKYQHDYSIRQLSVQ